jgi:hypothetical protein
MALIFVDCEAHYDSPCPGIGGGLTEFGAVEYESLKTFHGIPRNIKGDPLVSIEDRTTVKQYSSSLQEWIPTFLLFDEWLGQFEDRPIFVSDNPAYDWQWINYHFHHSMGKNPFGHSARRIGDFYAGVVRDFRAASKWKRFRKTKHDHNPVNDAMGNVEAFKHIISSL